MPNRLTRMTHRCAINLPDVKNPADTYGPPLVPGGTLDDVPCRHFANPTRDWISDGSGDHLLDGGDLWLDDRQFMGWLQSLEDGVQGKTALAVTIGFQGATYRVNEINAHYRGTHGQINGYILKIGAIR